MLGEGKTRTSGGGGAAGLSAAAGTPDAALLSERRGPLAVLAAHAHTHTRGARAGAPRTRSGGRAL